MAAYWLAAEVRTGETLPQEWAVTQNNLAHHSRCRERALLAADAEKTASFE